jgi:hypothetical protein
MNIKKFKNLKIMGNIASKIQAVNPCLGDSSKKLKAESKKREKGKWNCQISL